MSIQIKGPVRTIAPRACQLRRSALCDALQRLSLLVALAGCGEPSPASEEEARQPYLYAVDAAASDAATATDPWTGLPVGEQDSAAASPWPEPEPGPWAGPESVPDAASSDAAPFGEARAADAAVDRDQAPGIDGGELDTDADGLLDAVETNTGRYVGPLDTGTNPKLEDTDADGLLDGEEVSTTKTDPTVKDTDADGLFDGEEVKGTASGLDLPGMGCSPLKKNILLEYDWFDDAQDCTAHSHRPNAQTIQRVEDAFAKAPVDNPDGTRGIKLIQDHGQGGLFTGGNPIADADGIVAVGVLGPEFKNYRRLHFAAARDGYFHYVIMAHRYRNATEGSSGQAEITGDDLIVSLQCSYANHVVVANTIMHELGHNLSLDHGGRSIDEYNVNWKPNYNSVMNYRYQFDGVDTNCLLGGDGVLDYSSNERPMLDETALLEEAGICGNVPVNWDTDPAISKVPVSADINRDGQTTQLHDFDDWKNITLSRRGLVGRDPEVRISDCQNPYPGP